MRIQRDDRAVAEAMPHHEIRRADHAGARHIVLRYWVAFDLEADVPAERGHFGVSGAIAGRIVGRFLHERGEERDFLVEVLVDLRKQRRVESV